MPAPALLDERPRLYLEDLRVGQTFISRSHTIDEAQMIRFASEYDPQPFHLSEEGGRGTFFDRLVASGWYTAAITMRLVVEGGAPIAGGQIGAGGEITWPRPTLPGDTLHVRSEVTEIRPSRTRPDRGIVTIRTDTYNQHDEIVQVFSAKLVVRRRPAAA